MRLIHKSKLLATALEAVDLSQVHMVDTRRYKATYPTSEAANTATWPKLLKLLPVLATTRIPATEISAAVVAKSITWSDQDVNIYVGAEGRTLRSFLDLGAADFESVFDWHIRVARSLADSKGVTVHVSHGFNPFDSMPGLHSIRDQLHTHIHIPCDATRRTVPLDQMTCYEQLELIEPFTKVFDDRARYYATAGHLIGPVEARTGHLRLRGGPGSLIGIHGLLSDLYQVYESASRTLTAGDTEAATGHSRYIPRPQPERLARMAAFIDRNSAWISTESVDLLRYLAINVVDAAPRTDPGAADFRSPAQAWLAKGPCGAFNFVVEPGSDDFWFDFAPRVITTSPATKILGRGPTLITKNQGLATPNEEGVMDTFQHQVVCAVHSVAHLRAYKLS